MSTPILKWNASWVTVAQLKDQDGNVVAEVNQHNGAWFSEGRRFQTKAQAMDYAAGIRLRAAIRYPVNPPTPSGTHSE